MSDLELWIHVETVGYAASYLGVLTVSVVASAMVAKAEGRHGLTTAAVIAFAVLALFAVLDLGRTLAQVPLEWTHAPALRWGRVALSQVGALVLGLAFFRAGQRAGFRAPLELLSAAVLMALVGVSFRVYREGLAETPGWAYPVHATLGAVELGLFAAFYALCRQRLLAVGPGPAAAVDGAWRRPAEGLATYASAVKARLVIAIAAVPLAVLAGRSGDLGLVKGVVVLATLASFATGAFVVAGLWKFSQQPAPAHGGAATTAIALMGVGAMFELWTVTLALRLDQFSVGAAFAYTKQAPWAEAGGQVCGALALLGVLGAMRSAAEAVRAQGLAEKAWNVAWLLGGGGLAAAVVKVIATSVRNAEVLLLVAVPLLIAMLVGVVRFFGLLTALSSALSASTRADSA